jgi:hypothetical protein
MHAFEVHFDLFVSVGHGRGGGGESGGGFLRLTEVEVVGLNFAGAPWLSNFVIAQSVVSSYTPPPNEQSTL